MNTSSQRLKVWTAPSVLAVLTMIGLLSALLGEEITWKALAWIFLAAPVLAAAWFSCLKPWRSQATRR
jgi:xanthosine utilization system XapX-like protein